MLVMMWNFIGMLFAGLMTFLVVTGLLLLKVLPIFAKIAFVYGSFYCGVSAFTLSANLLMKGAGVLSIANALKEITGISHLNKKNRIFFTVLMSVGTLACGIFCIGSGCPVIPFIILDSSLNLLKGAKEYLTSVIRGSDASREPVPSDIISHRVLNSMDYNRVRDVAIPNRVDIPREWEGIQERGQNVNAINISI